jgi:phosphatidylglycerol---prolipoprotein diacylglyceryl transferase
VPVFLKGHRMLIHTAFDMVAAITAMTMTVLVYRWRLADAAARIESAGLGYVLALAAGAAIGGFGLGSLNLWISGDPGIARSIVGALAGAITAIEVFKWWHGMRGSTGIIFVPGFAATVMVGRWGCFFAGLEDKTFGVATGLPWGRDFGDGVMRHPVQLYESAAMLAFLVFALAMLARRNAWFMQNGFYAMALTYAVQRFLWEFLKPYGPVIGSLNLFHLVCAALAVYACIMMRGQNERRAT